MITKKALIELNKEFDVGKVMNEGSLDFAISNANATKDWIKQLAYLIRAILIDHAFSEGNKRSSSALIIGALEEKKLGYDPYKIDNLIINIVQSSITNINQIRRMIKDVIR
ncbi:MAG: hypothetical protein AABW57_01275 [Nanoarchaeota archaeon]